MPNTVRRPDDDRRRWEAQRRRQREEAERREQARTSRDRRQRTTQLERQSLMGPMDLPFLLLTLLLTGVGLVMVFSASFPSAYYETGDGTYYFKRQLIFAVLGLFAMVVMSRINYQRLRGASKLLLGFAVFLLVLVIVPKNPLAITNNNATRWLGTEGFSFQPSEIAKLAVVIYFADSISKKKRKMETWRYGIVPYLAVLGLIAILMMLEPHLSGTILIVGTGIVMMIVGGIQRWLVAAGLGGVGIVAVLYVQLVEKGIIQYGKGRIDTWRDPFNEAWFHGDGWQISQSLIAIGSGGLLGVGLGKSRQKFLYLPEEHNDCIFAVVCEELGLIGACVVMLLFALVMNSRMKSAFKENRRRIADINSQIEDSLSGIRVVKSFGNETEEMRKFNAGNDRFVDSKKVSYRYMGIYNSGMGAFSTLITVISLIVGALLMTGGKLGAADLVTFLLYINNCTDPVKKLVNFTEQFQNGYSGYERFLEIMSIAPDIQDKPDALPLKNVQGEVTFENVSFHYEESKENVLSNVNLHVPAGDYVALVGSSGAGKTTLCSLLPRFYDVTEGRILLDGKDIRDVKLKDLRDEIGIVQQDVYLFAGTIIDNIRYGRPDATDEEVIRAAKAANAHEFIMELADGYDTDIGQRGVKLSGGQKQRLSIARVFLKNPPILIFDEATSALDNESEKVVQKSLELLAKDRTTFVIAHRLSTIRNAKRILVLTENGIAEEGTHKELLAKGGIYAHLYEMQF